MGRGEGLDDFGGTMVGFDASDISAIDELLDGFSVVRGSVMPTAIAQEFFDVADIYPDYDAIAEREFEKRMQERGRPPERLDGRAYVITGDVRGYWKRRNDVYSLLEAKGALAQSGITRSTTALFVCDIQKWGNSTNKLKKAQQYGVKILGWEDLIWHIKDPVTGRAPGMRF